jgi:hypothetical protein
MVTADGVYTGVSGYGEGSMMTLSDYGKFLAMVCSKGRAPDGRKVLGTVAWKWLMSPTTNSETGHDLTRGMYIFNTPYNLAEWKMG